MWSSGPELPLKDPVGGAAVICVCRRMPRFTLEATQIALKDPVGPHLVSIKGFLRRPPSYPRGLPSEVPQHSIKDPAGGPLISLAR